MGKPKHPNPDSIADSTLTQGQVGPGGSICAECFRRRSILGPNLHFDVGEFLRTGTCLKMDQWAERIPRTVLELTAIPGLGAKTIRTLYTEHGIKSLNTLRKALDKGKLDGARGIGNKTVERMQRFIAEQELGSKRL